MHELLQKDSNSIPSIMDIWGVETKLEAIVITPISRQPRGLHSRKTFPVGRTTGPYEKLGLAQKHMLLTVIKI